MRQFQISYQDLNSFKREVESWRTWRDQNGAGDMLIHIFSDGADEADVKLVRILVEHILPDAMYVGASASGCLYEGKVSTEKLVVSCTIFEKPDSFVRTHLFSIEDRDPDSLRQSLRAMRDSFAGVKAIEAIVTIDTIPIREVCSILQEEIPAEIQIWGGGAFGDNTFTAYVFEKGSPVNTHGLVMCFLGGEDFHVMNTYVVGWKPLGSELKVTRAEGNLLHELDNAPAYEIYHHYLRIPNDEHIFYNALEFPFAVNCHDHVLLRHALACLEDGTLVMSTDIPEGSILHVTYGDPETILQNVQQCARHISDFAPEVISVFDCFGRKTFWGGTDASRETRPLHQLAPTYGFCTAGELIRCHGGMDHHNLSLVVSAMREGGPVERETPEHLPEPAQNESSMSMVSRLVNFINTATKEVEEAYTTLSRVAITDRLTQLYNRGEIQRRITERIQEHCADPTGENATSLVMLDLDDFKHVNDTYGHQEGDEVLISTAAVIREAAEACSGASGGRWGGEEFMVLLPGVGLEDAAAFAEGLRAKIAKLSFPLCGGETASFGVAQARPGEAADPLVFRADEALYEAKHAGKNCVHVSKNEA